MLKNNVFLPWCQLFFQYLAELKDELAAVGVPHNDELWESVSIEDEPVKGYEEQSSEKATGSEEVGTNGK